MSMYQDFRRQAIEQVERAITTGGSFDAIRASLIIGVIYALLAIAAAVSDLKP